MRLTRIMLLSPILLAMGAVASSVLNARGRFGAAAVAPSLYNLAIIGGAIFLGPILGIRHSPSAWSSDPSSIYWCRSGRWSRSDLSSRSRWTSVTPTRARCFC